jgi:hypothetical protein
MLPRFSDKSSSLDEEMFDEISQRLRGALSTQNLLVKPDVCEYVVADDVLIPVRDLAEAFFRRMPVRMGSEVRVGEVTFGDFCSFWSALLSLIETHWMAHALACGGNFAQLIQTIVINKPRLEMARLISSISRLSPQASEFILRCYLYDPTVNGKGPPFQPIVPIVGDSVCFSSLMVSHYAFERNFFKLLNRSLLLQPFAASVNSQKERAALRYLSTLFPKPEYATREGVPISGPKRTDADLLVYESRSGFALVIQHKWLTAPETPEESSSNDEYLTKGITQGIDARDYLRSKPAFVRQVLNLPESAPINRVECVTVCRGLEGSGFMERNDVPVIEEQAMENLFKNAGGLETLWTALLARPDKLSAAEQAVDTKMPISLGGYRFRVPALGFR